MILWSVRVITSPTFFRHFAEAFGPARIDLSTRNWENTDGKGTFQEHAVAMNARGHDARVGDVDCDGDLDIAGKPWGEGEPEPRDHIYLQNMTVERGGKAVFQRPKGEVWRAGQTAEHCP